MSPRNNSGSYIEPEQQHIAIPNLVIAPFDAIVAGFPGAADRAQFYEVSAMNLNHATMAHIHSGKVGVNGPVVLVIYDSNTRSGPMGPGILSQGNATSANLEGPLAGKQMSDLVNLIKSGEAYVNVHTVQNSKGEIRGQIS